MGRRVVDRIESASWGIKQERLQAAGKDGQPLFDGAGMPRMLDLTTLVVQYREGQTLYELELPFTDDARRRLVAALSGGIVLPAAGNGHPTPGS